MCTRRSAVAVRASVMFLWGSIAGVTAFGVPGVALGAPSAVDMAQARELLNMGLELRGKGDVAGALLKLKAAYALVHTPITGLELGRTYMTLGNLVEARETFLGNARLPERPEETSRSKAARKESDQLAEQLRSRIPSLTVKITGVPSDTVAVTVDGASVPNEALAAPRLVDPGTHIVSARSTSGGTAETTVDLKEGEARDVELKIVFTGGRAQATAQSAPTASPSPASSPAATAPLTHADTSNDRASEASHARSHVFEWSLIGAGVALGAAGAALMVVESNASSDAANRQDRSAYDSANSLWTGGMIASIVGGAAIITGGIVLIAAGGDSGSHGSGQSAWIGVGPGILRVGGTW